jgi:ubiquitin-activating enzyme E1
MSTKHENPLKKLKITHLPAMSRESSDNLVAAMDSIAMNRFSRQNAALGAETTAKLIKMNIIIVGLRGIGMETAKNLALQGAGGMTLVDGSGANIHDVGLNFFITTKDVESGATRANIVAPKLRELNPQCVISVAPMLSEDLLQTHSALVITDSSIPLSDILKWNSFCRSRNIAFFYAFISGVSASIFSDLGPLHVIVDPTGSRPMQKLVTGISAIDDSITLIHYDTPEGQPPIALSEGFYEISDVTGIDGINKKVFSVSHPSSDPVKTVRVNFAVTSPYQYGGQLLEKRLPTDYPMDSLEFKLKNPGNPFAEPPTTVLTDLINFGAETQQHIAMYAVLEFAEKRGRLPAANDEKDAVTVVDLAKALLESKAVDVADLDLDVDFVTKYSKQAAIELQPMAAFIGGVLAQEVVKGTGKFTPIPGFMHFSAREVLPSEAPADTSPRGSRYDYLAAIFGWEFVEKLHSLQYFMVGCGALGCEFMYSSLCYQYPEL